MILNLYSIITLFISIVTGTLAAVLLFFTVKATLKKELNEERFYLVLLIAVVVASIKALSMPLFFITLWSFVPYILGAMCIYGVMQAGGSFSVWIQVFKLVMFFIVTGWLFLEWLEGKKDKRSVFHKTRFILLLMVASVTLLDSVLESFYILHFNPDADVSCCSTVFDLPQRQTLRFAKWFFGAMPEDKIIAGYILFNISLIGVYLFAINRKRHDRCFLAFMGILAFFNGLYNVFALFEILAPKIMKLPGHHCIYCMWQYKPLTALASLMLVFGSFVPGWVVLLNRFSTVEFAALQLFTKRLIRAGLIATIGQFLIFIVSSFV